MKVVQSEEMRAIDRQAIEEYGIPGVVLMENAGIRTVEVIEDILAGLSSQQVLILVGKGNNGGDGLVIARHLINGGIPANVFMLGQPEQLTPDALVNYRILEQMKAPLYPLQTEEDLDRLTLALLKASLVVDAIYGIGFKGSLDDFETQVVKLVNWSQLPVVAVDIASGVEADSGRIHGAAIKAIHTVTFGLPKLGQLIEPGKSYTGTLTVADISLPRDLLTDPELKINLITDELVQPFLYPRAAQSHKGIYGHALIIGGSTGMTGAVIMAARAALRVGAGLVTAALPESLQGGVENEMVEVMTVPLAETAQGTIAREALPAIENLLGTTSVCAIGPGMSRYREAPAILHQVLERAGIPIVIDADGLNAVSEDINILKDRQIPIVLTPHPGEMARLTGLTIEEIQADRLEIARSSAQKWGVTVVLKGSGTVVAYPSGEVFLNLSGNPGMATAGSGDVLCGMITGLIAQGLRPQDAAMVAVYLHGLTGDYVEKVKGQRGLIAGDIIEGLPEVLRGFEAAHS
ncbi:MAG: NAD(P)H-hydrate dehydratase [Syntrophomonadaceae bacterium]|jgi:NAD(P)H-hydrate epimerase|nr:NAD(P)H-hydrate dehydratase [Syntrophomonadaceae bacterium]